MTYKLNPIVGQCISPVILSFQDGNAPDRHFENGAALASEIFDRPYLIANICAQENQIVLTVKENNLINGTEWVRKDNASNTSFF